MKPPTCQSPGPVYPAAHGGPEDDDGGGNDQTVGGGQPEVLAPELQHVTTSSEPPHVVAPGGESVGSVHPPGHPGLDLHTEQSERECQSDLTKPQHGFCQIFVLHNLLSEQLYNFVLPSLLLLLPFSSLMTRKGSSLCFFVNLNHTGFEAEAELVFK